MSFRQSGRRARRIPVLLALGVSLFLGCGKGKDKEGDAPADDKTGNPKEQGGDPKPEAKVGADELYRDRAKYDGKWVVVIARVPRVHTGIHPDGRKDASVDIQDDRGEVNISGRFTAEEWAKTPKFEDGVRYEILGKFSGIGNLGGVLWDCKVLGVHTGAGPAPEATLTADELLADSAKYKDKVVVVKGTLKNAVPAPGGGAVNVAGSGDKFVTCVCAAGQFEAVIRGGRVPVEIKGVVTGTGAFVTMSDCTLAKPVSASPVKAAVFTRDFAQDAEAADKKHKDKSVTVVGRVESVADGKLVIEGLKDAKGKIKGSGPQKLVATFGPDWKAALAKLKPGDEVTVSGEYGSYSPGEVTLNDCWVITK